MSKRRSKKPYRSLGWQVADDPEWEFVQSSHMPLYAGSHHAEDSQSLISLTTKPQESSGISPTVECRIRRGTATSFLDHIREDLGSICLLLFLYILQGVPLGLTASIPLVLQNRHITYSQQAIFSFAYWPFSLKLLWAPIVDSCYWQKLGRRKSWLVPTQYLIGIFMLILSCHVGSILGDDVDSLSSSKPNVLYLAVVFFAFNFLAATQDIAVDGWALTMLSKKNVGYASTCNAVGQTAGYFLGNVVFLALESSEFCNKYLRSEPQPNGLVTLAEFCYYWAWIFIITTTMVLIFKRENNQSIDSDITSDATKIEPIDEADDLSLKETYKILYEVVKLKPVIGLVVVHLTAKVAFAAADGITGLKLIELGVPKDKLAFLAIPLVPLQILLPIIIGKYTAGPTPLTVYLKAYPYRLIMGIIFPFIVYVTPTFKDSTGHYPLSYYALLVVVYCFHQITVYSIFVAIMAFHAQISDPLVGGTYMTLMNTVSNLGGNWPVTFVLSIVDRLTWKSCFNSEGLTIVQSSCSSASQVASCESAGGSCQSNIDGYYVLTAACTIIGILWFKIFRTRVDRLQRVDKSLWTLKRGC